MILQELAASDKFNLFLLTTRNSSIAEKARKAGVRVFEIEHTTPFHSKKNIFFKIYQFFKTIITIIVIYFRESIDIIHCHSLLWAHYAQIMYLIFRSPVIIDIVYFGDKPNWFRKFLFHITKQKIVYLAISESSKKFFLSEL